MQDVGLYSKFVWLPGRLRFKCDGTHAETRFRLSAKRTSPLKSAGASVQSTIGSRGVRISGSSAGYTMFRGSVKSTGYPLHSSVSPSLPVPCVNVCHHVSTGLYNLLSERVGERLFAQNITDSPHYRIILRLKGLHWHHSREKLSIQPRYTNISTGDQAPINSRRNTAVYTCYYPEDQRHKL